MTVKVSVIAVKHPKHENLYLHGKRRDSGRWALPGGHGNPGESEKECALRECEEETGVKPKNLKKLHEKKVKTEDGDNLHISLFSGDLDTNNVTSKHDPDEEFSDFKFLDPTSHGDMHIHGKRNILLDYLKNNKLNKSQPIKLVHFSNTPNLTTLDPGKMGSAGTKGVESKQGRPGVDRTYFYREGTEHEPMVVNHAKAKYHTELAPHHRLYDVANDHENIYSALKEASMSKPVNAGMVSSDEYLQAIKDKGYHGFFNSRSSLPNAVGIFHPMHVTEDKSFKKSEDLEKAELPPTKTGELHPTKPYIAKKHPSGGVAWFYNNDSANMIDNKIKEMKEPFIAKYPQEHQPLIRDFVDKVSNAYTRHAVPAKDNRTGPDVVRARHLAGIMQGGQNYALTVHDPNNLTFSMHERHGQDARPSNIKFTKVSQPNADKSISKREVVNEKESLRGLGRTSQKRSDISGIISKKQPSKGINLGSVSGRIPRSSNDLRLDGHSRQQGRISQVTGTLQLNLLKTASTAAKSASRKPDPYDSLFDYHEDHGISEEKENRFDIGQDPNGQDPFAEPDSPKPYETYFNTLLNKLPLKNPINYFRSKLQKLKG